MDKNDENNAPNAPVPDSPVFAQINYVGQQVSTTVSPGVSNEMLMVGIVHLVAQLTVRTNAACCGLLPLPNIIGGLLQKIGENTPQIIPLVNAK